MREIKFRYYFECWERMVDWEETQQWNKEVILEMFKSDNLIRKHISKQGVTRRFL